MLILWFEGYKYEGRSTFSYKTRGMPPSEYKISKGRNYMNKKKEISDLEYNAL